MNHSTGSIITRQLMPYSGVAGPAAHPVGSNLPCYPLPFLQSSGAFGSAFFQTCLSAPHLQAVLYYPYPPYPSLPPPLFVDTNQDHTSIGRWKGWSWDSGLVMALFDNGQYCPGGPATGTVGLLMWQRGCKLSEQKITTIYNSLTQIMSIFAPFIYLIVGRGLSERNQSPYYTVSIGMKG